MKNDQATSENDKLFMSLFDTWLAQRAAGLGFRIDLLTHPQTTFDMNDMRAAYLALTRDPEFVVKLAMGNDRAPPALLHLQQAIAAGCIMPDELLSLREHAPRFVAMLADGMNVSPARLKEMASQRQLTLSIIAKAMQ